MFNIDIFKFICANAEITSLQGHKFLVTQVFDVIANAQPRVDSANGYKFIHTTITTEDVREGITEHVIKGYPEQLGESDIEVDGLYSINGRLLALNEESSPVFLYKPTHKLISRSLSVAASDAANNAFATSLGIVIEIEEEHVRPNGVVNRVVVEHKDYDRVNGREVIFSVDYISRTKFLCATSLTSLNIGDEVLMVGYIVGQNQKSRALIVEVNYFKAT